MLNVNQKYITRTSVIFGGSPLQGVPSTKGKGRKIGKKDYFVALRAP